MQVPSRQPAQCWLSGGLDDDLGVDMQCGVLRTYVQLRLRVAWVIPTSPVGPAQFRVRP
jgi:hypothetical protein